MRIAIDIDSTLHHYWDQLVGRRAAPLRRRAARTRSRSRGRSRCCAPSRCAPCVRGDALARRTCSPPSPTRARSRPSAPGTRPATSSTSPRTARPTRHAATARWLERIGLPYDELYCSYDKVARCREIGIDVLIDDSPVQPRARARRRHDRGDAAASLEPRAVRDRGRDLRATDWPELARAPGAGAAHDPRPRCRPPRRSADLRDHLPAIEPDRTVTDWGRSERSRAWSTGRSTRSSTTTGSAARSRGSRTSRPPAARCSSPTTPARCRPTRR